MEDEVVFCEEGFAVIKSIRPFSTGYNCYKEDKEEAGKLVKINDVGSWFTTMDAAKKWMDEYKAKI